MVYSDNPKIFNAFVLFTISLFLNIQLCKPTQHIDAESIKKDNFSIQYYAPANSKSHLTEESLIRFSGGIDSKGNLYLPNDIGRDTSNILITRIKIPVLRWNSPSVLRNWEKSLSVLPLKYPKIKSIQIDWEGYKKEDSTTFRDFLCHTKNYLQNQNNTFRLDIALFPPDHPDNKGFHDWRILPACVNRIYVMMYDYHNPRTNPGKVIDNVWLENNLSLIEEISGRNIFSQIVLGLPLYGYIWNKKGKFIRAITKKELNKTPPSQKKNIYENNIIHPPSEDLIEYSIKRARHKGLLGIVYWRWGFE